MFSYVSAKMYKHHSFTVNRYSTNNFLLWVNEVEDTKALFFNTPYAPSRRPDILND